MGKNDDSTFEIGYKKPPLHTRFKPGKSGNLNGRPKKEPQAISDTFRKELARKTQINVGGRSLRISMIEVIAKQYTAQAAKGDIKAAQLVLNVVSQNGSDRKDGLSPIVEMLRNIHAEQEAAPVRSAELDEPASDAAPPIGNPNRERDET